MLEELAKECKKIGLEVNVDKTRWMANQPITRDIMLEGKIVQKTDSYCYLNQLLQMPKNHNQELGKRIGAA